MQSYQKIKHNITLCNKYKLYESIKKESQNDKCRKHLQNM